MITITIEGEALIGALGAGIELDTDNGSFKITPPTVGIGGSYSIDFDITS